MEATPRELALAYLDIFCDGTELERLRDLFAPDLRFSGPFVEFDSAGAYIESLLHNPPQDCRADILHVFEQENRVNLIYRFSRPGLSTLMSQVFEVRGGRITRIILIFDTGPFRA